MKKPINREKITAFKPMRESLNLETAIKEANRCLLCEDAPCSKECPAGTDPGKFIRQIKFENYKGAARTVRENNICGNTCAFICPVGELCEKACSAKALEDPIDIGGLQRFACEYGRELGIESFEVGEKEQGKVAIIGAGPASMSCAAELAKLGYEVTLFEKEEKAGGIAQWNIPDYRLPKEAIDNDIQNLLNLGVIIQYGREIKNKSEIENLLKEGYQTVFIGVGLTAPMRTPLLNAYDNAMGYYDFLRKIKTSEDKSYLKGKQVIVIGGGSVALDSACSAVASGAVATVVYRRTELEMPAEETEIELAHKLGVNFKTTSILTEVIAEGKKIKQVKGIGLSWKDRNHSEEVAGTEFSLNADYVIEAIGTKPMKELSIIAPELKIAGKGMIVVNKDGSTNIPGVFAGGDVVSGGRTIVQAVGEGKIAAKSIDQFLRRA